MIEKIKEAQKEVNRLKEKYETAERNVINSVWEYGVIGFVGGVQVDGAESLKELAGDAVITSEERKDDFYPYELSFEKEGLTFFTILTKEEFKDYIAKIEDEENDYAFKEES